METMHLAGEMTFRSPINLENSFHSWNLAKRATSIMRLYFDGADASYGSIEWEIPSLDRLENIGLRFGCNSKGKRTLVDYDGVFTLPKQAMKLCEQHGIDVTEMRKSLRDAG